MGWGGLGGYPLWAMQQAVARWRNGMPGAEVKRPH